MKMNPTAYHYNNKDIDLDRMIRIIKLFLEQVFKLLLKVLFKLVLILLFRLVLIKIVKLIEVLHLSTGEWARAERGAFRYNHVNLYLHLNIDSICHTCRI